jgi:aminoglycoside 6'-N-acetyltransferase
VSEPVQQLHGQAVTLRRIDESDIAELVELWAASPIVQRRWYTFGERELREVLAGEDETVGWRIEAAGELVGFIQQYAETDPDYRHGGIDVFIADHAQGAGLGTDAVRTVARHLVADLGHHRLVIDPAADNERAIRCYERVGFRRVGIMRSYERGPDGSFHDGLLMDLLADELTAGGADDRPA